MVNKPLAPTSNLALESYTLVRAFVVTAGEQNTQGGMLLPEVVGVRPTSEDENCPRRQLQSRFRDLRPMALLALLNNGTALPALISRHQ